MAIKAGQILHDANGFTIDRIQTAGAGNLNIPEERIYELGNYQTVATIRDIPDLSFDLESLDVSTEIEALLVGKDPTTVVNGDEIDFLNSMPLDIISPFKSGNGNFDIVRGVATPYLNLENVTYRFGVRANATQAYTLRGDSIYYTPGNPFYEEFTISGTGPYTLAHTAIPYVESGSTIYVLSVCLKNSTTHRYKRLFHGADYTDTSTSFTLTNTPDAAYNKIHVVYASTAATSYTQTGNNPNGHLIHQGTSVKPAAVRGKDIDIYISDGAATPTFTRWTGVQSVEITRRVNLQNDEELGNKHYVAQDYDTAEVTGNVVLKAVDPQDLFDRIAAVANVTTSEVAGPYSSIPVGVEVRVSDPDTGTLLKTLYVPDARFTVPGVQGRVQTKLEVTFTFSSDGGTLKVYKGAR